MPKLELISFILCPFVQRSVITLEYKKAQYEVTYIDLENPPEWFVKISPLEQVPVLRVDDQVAIFESAVINEYLDETIGTPLHSGDPLVKARERAWIEYGSTLLFQQYRVLLEKDSSEFEKKLKTYLASLKLLEAQVSSGPYFRGEDFSLVDAAYAPLFMRGFLAKKTDSHPDWKFMPKVRAWGESLMKVDAVKVSVPQDFPERYLASARENGSLAIG